MLYGQLHEGLKYDIIKAPGVSGVDSYSALHLKKRQQYSKPESKPLPRPPNRHGQAPSRPRDKHLLGRAPEV